MRHRLVGPGLERSCALALETSLPAIGRDVTINYRSDYELTHWELAAGVALADYITQSLLAKPEKLGLLEVTPEDVARAEIEISKAQRADVDILIALKWPERTIELPISLKVNQRLFRTQVLGSNSARGTLSRLFLGMPRVTNATFVDYFEDPAVNYLSLVSDLKLAASEFYNSEQGKEFIDKYQKRLNLPKSARVNNPLRRREVGNHFFKTRGFKSENEFARLYVQMFNIGCQTLGASRAPAAELFTREFRKVLGINPEILTLNVITDSATGAVVRVESSRVSDPFGQVSGLLFPGVEVEHQITENCATMPVLLNYRGHESSKLTLSVWIDATLQYKLLP